MAILLEGTAIVTGGGSGIGREAALAFARAGARVVIADRDTSTGEETAHLVEGISGKAAFVPADIAKNDDVQCMIDTTVKLCGSLDYAFNNAGIATENYAPIADYDEAEWDRIIAVDLKGVWLCLKHECRQMLRQGRGAIVSTASIVGKVGRPGLSAYTAAKAGVIGLTRTAALDYAAQGIRINAVCPGGINTAMTAAIKDRMESFTANIPMRRMGESREIADAVVWLCSPQASYITGQALDIDGAYGV